MSKPKHQKRRTPTNAQKKARNRKAMRQAAATKKRVAANETTPSVFSGFEKATAKPLNLAQKMVTTNYRMRFSIAAAAAGSALHTYTTGWRTLDQESYFNHLNSIASSLSDYGIAYDPSFQNSYLGSFGGAILFPMVYKVLNDAQDRIAMSKRVDNMSTREIIEESYSSDIKNTRLAFGLSAVGLTGKEIFDAQIPGRSFDYGDMTAYGLAFALCFTGLHLAARKAKRTFASVSDSDLLNNDSP